MTAPLYAFDIIGENTGLLVAVIIGFFFGFFLERGGLGNPHKLIGVFYLRDFTVPKVIFTAIIVAATGLYLLSDIGLLDIDSIWFVPTFFWPQIIGGLLFGAGFVISGYCPGTAVAGFASGRLDAFVTMVGISLGSFIFAILFPFIGGFYSSSSMYKATLQNVFNVSHWTVIPVLALIALIMFLFMERYEKRY